MHHNATYFPNSTRKASTHMSKETLPMQDLTCHNHRSPSGFHGRVYCQKNPYLSKQTVLKAEGTLKHDLWISQILGFLKYFFFFKLKAAET